MPSEKTQVAIDHPSTTFAAPPAIVSGALDDAGDIQNPIAPGGMTDDRQPGFHGQGTPGDTIVIRDNGNEIGTTEVDANGSWTFTPSTDLLEGQHAITIVTRDDSGNEGTPSPAFNFEIDVTPPDASRLNVSGFTDNVGGVTGNVISGGTTDETRPLLSGISNGTPGHTVTVMVKDATGTHELGPAIIGENGQWTFQVDTPLAAGLNTFMLVERDAAGNETMPTGRYKVTVNTDKPNAPVIDSVFDDVGEAHMLQQGEATNDARPTLAGTAQANHIVKFYDGATYLGQTVADESGKWSFTPQTNLTDGAHGITATSTSPVGQTSDASSAWNFVIDTTPPTQTGTVTDIGKDSGFNADDYLTNDGGAGRLLQGKLSAALGAGETLQVSTDGGTTWTTAFVAGDQWSAQDGNSHTESWTVQTRTVDEAGNAGPVQSQAMALDTVAPAAPTEVAVVAGGVEVRFNPADVAVGHKLSLVLRGDHFDYVLTAADIATGKVQIADQSPPVLLNFNGLKETVNSKSMTFGDLTIKCDNGVRIWIPTPTNNDPRLWIGTVGGVNYSSEYLIKNGANHVSFDLNGINGDTAGKEYLVYFDVDGQKLGQLDLQYPLGSVQRVSFDPPPGKMIGSFIIFTPRGETDGYTVDDIKIGKPLSEFEITAAISDPAGNISKYTSSNLRGKDSFDNLSKINAGTSHTTAKGVDIEMVQGFVEPSNYSSLYLSAQGIVSFKIPTPAKSVEIEYGNTHGAPYGKVEFYSAEGVLLGTKNMVAHPDSSAGMAKIGFSSNTPISYIKVYGQDSGTAPGVNDAILIGDLSWSGVDTGSSPAQQQTLTEGSVGTLHGGSDNNEFVVTDIKHLSDSAISGNGGIDTLKLTGANQVLDLTALAGKVSSVEIIDLTGSGNNTLKLSLADVMNNGAINQFVADGRVQMMVKGNAGDAVTLSDVLPNGTDTGDWVKQANISVWGVVYEVYQHSGFKADLLVQQGVTVTLQNTGAGTFHISPEAEVHVLDHATQTYTDSDDTLIARLGFADRLEGGAGNDTFMKVGTGDTVHGGAGDDTIRINSGDFARLDGGLGIDTLVMDGTAMHIDLSALGAKVLGFEKFDLGAGGNTLALSAQDLLAGGARDMVTADGKVQMLVNGANGDVNLLGGDDGWTLGNAATVGGVTYSVYTNLAGTAELLVEDKVHVTIL